MKHIKDFQNFEQENEGLKTWGAGLMAALSLFTSSAFGGNIKTKGEGKSQDMSIAIKKAMTDARTKVLTQMKLNQAELRNGEFTDQEVTKDKDGNYVATINFTIDSSNVANPKAAERFEVMPGQEVKTFMKDIVDMGFTGLDQKEINNFVDKYADNYNFKVSKMTKDEASKVGEISIKLSKTMKSGVEVYCVVTPIK